MLYDPTWNKTPSCAGLIAWLETQDPERTYDWLAMKGCLICFYYDALGINDFSDVNRPMYEETFSRVEQYYAVCETEPWTFGAALARARLLRGD
jgi:hypothetical protein